ncbi:MAG: O-antigen ligase family protein [Patescibacteria group bacterium]
MLRVKPFIRLCIAASIALLSIAHLKLIVFGIPLYSVEMPIFVASIAYAYGWRRKIFSPFGSIDFRNPFVIGILLFFFGAVLSFAVNPFSLTGLGMLKTWFVFPLAASWLWLETKPDNRDLERLLFVWLGVTALSACASLVFFAQGALTYDGRLEAWYASPNYLAFFLAPGVLLAVYMLSSSFFAKRHFLQTLLWLSLAALVLALFLTRSYEVWVGVCAALLIFFLLGKRESLSWRGSIAAALLLVGVFSSFVFLESGSEKWQSLATLNERSSFASREMIWQAAAKIIADHPFFGIGIGRFQETYLAYQQYFPPYLEWAAPQPHNLYLAVWLEAGIMGLLGFFLLIAAWFRNLSSLRHSDDGNERIKKISALLMALFGLYLILGLVDTPFFKTDSAFIFWFILAFGIGLNRQNQR